METNSVQVLYVDVKKAYLLDKLCDNIDAWATGKCSLCCASFVFRKALDENPKELIDFAGVIPDGWDADIVFYI